MRLQQRIRREQAKHTDDWLITYADTITLLLCLFVVLLSIRITGKTLTREATMPVMQTATPEEIFWGRSGVRPPPPVAGSAIEAIVPATICEASAPDPAPPRRIVVAEAPPRETHPLVPAPQESDAPQAAPHPSPSVVDRLQSRDTPIVEQHGDRITTLQINSAAFFASGSAVLSSAGRSILGDVAVTLRSAEFAAYRIAVEGHTDDAPISTVLFQSNWELSAARAAAVVRFLLEQGLTASKLTAAGYADTFPVAPNRNADGTINPENQSRNRRVVIKLEKIDKAER